MSKDYVKIFANTTVCIFLVHNIFLGIRTAQWRRVGRLRAPSSLLSPATPFTLQRYVAPSSPLPTPISSWCRAPPLTPRALLTSGAVGSRALAGQRPKQADFTFRDPSRSSGTTTHVPSADPRTLQLHLRDFPFSPPPSPPLPESTTRTRARRRQRAYTVLRCSYPRSRLYFLD